MRPIANGSQSFSEIREQNAFYIDKTGFISEWYQSQNKVTLITRPRRFGKTLTLDMIRCFFGTEYASREDLFYGLEVSKNSNMMLLQGTFPVLYLSFANQHPSTFHEFILMLSYKVGELFNSHRYLVDENALNDEEKDFFFRMAGGIFKMPQMPTSGNDNPTFSEWLFLLKQSVQALSIWIYRHSKKKVILLMDEYDTPLQSAYISGFWSEAVSLMRDFLGNTFKSNEAMHRGLIIGITCIAREPLFADLNHLTVSSVLSDSYSTSFGFTQEEVDAALEEYDALENREDVKARYDGFTFGDAINIYNPWSICCFLNVKPHALISYWAQSGGVGLVDRLIRKFPEALFDLRSLILGEPILCSISEELVYPELNTNPNAIWSLLLAAGYLRPARESEIPQRFRRLSENELILQLTNREMKDSFVSMAHQWLVNGTNGTPVSFLQALEDHDLPKMTSALQKIVDTCVSSFDSGNKPAAKKRPQPEKYFQGLLTGLAAWLLDRYTITSQGESGDGRYDLSLRTTYPVDDVILFEFKVYDPKLDGSLNKTARRARDQIDTNRYDALFLSQGIPTCAIHKYGVGFKGKNVLILS